VSAILVWTCLTVFFLGASSQYYIVTSCICSCFVCYFDSRSAYFNVCDNWSVWCDCGYNKWICVRPVTEYFLTVCVTFPSVAVCVVCSLLYIFECSRGLNLVLVYRSVIFVCDAVTVCGDYIVVTCSTFGITGKDCCCFVANNFNAGDHWSIWFFICGFSISFNRLGTCVVLGGAVSCYCVCSVSVILGCVLCSWNRNISVHNSYDTVSNFNITVFNIFLVNTPVEFVGYRTSVTAFALYSNRKWFCSCSICVMVSVNLTFNL